MPGRAVSPPVGVAAERVTRMHNMHSTQRWREGGREGRRPSLSPSTRADRISRPTILACPNTQVVTARGV